MERDRRRSQSVRGALTDHARIRQIRRHSESWPQSYSATAWHAPVKDALEDHPNDPVCGGDLELATAQRLISTDSVVSYSGKATDS